MIDIKGFLRHTVHVIRIILGRCLTDHYTYTASALTYTTLLSLVPFMTVTLSILSAFPAFNAYAQEMQNAVFNNFVPDSGAAIQAHLAAFAQQTGKLSAIGMVVLFVTAIMLLLTIEHSLNDIWRIKTGRRGVSALVRYWAVLSLSPIFVGLSFVMTSYVFSFFHVAQWLLSVLPFLLVFLGFTVLYVVVPNCQVKIRHGMIGAFVATVFFETAKYGFASYVVKLPTYQLIYGAFAIIPLFLLWIYISWIIILFGASVSHTVATVQRVTKGVAIDGFSHAYLWLKLLWEAQKTGDELTLSQCLKRAPWHYAVDPEVLLATLVEHDFIKVTESGAYVLARACDQMTLKALFDVLPWHLPREGDLNVLLAGEHQKYCDLIHSAHHCLGQSLDKSLVSLYE